MNLAVIKTGGKQYLVREGKKIKVEKIDKKEGEEIVFDEVLLLRKEKNILFGRPFVEGARVVAKIIKQAKDKKVIVFKHKPRKRYKVKKGHRQLFSEIQIEKIE